jgi:hypothetical protein
VREVSSGVGTKLRKYVPDDFLRVRDEKSCVNYMLFDLENIPESDLPDGYRKELDIVVKRPGGKWVACTIAWFDSYNRMGTLEPVGAIQLRMGREVVMEGLRRLRDQGALVAHMDAGLKY